MKLINLIPLSFPPLIVLLSLSFLLGCSPDNSFAGNQEIHVEFEVLKQDIYGVIDSVNYSLAEIIIVDNASKVSSEHLPLKNNKLDFLNTIDYDQHLVLFISQGVKGSSGYEVQVEKIIQGNNIFYIHANFVAPQPEQAILHMMTRPHQFVSIQKPPSWELEPSEFQLIVDGELVYSTVSGFLSDSSQQVNLTPAPQQSPLPTWTPPKQFISPTLAPIATP